MHERPGVSNLFLSNMDRLRVAVLAAVSDEKSAELCLDGGASFFFYSNDSLSDKWNAVVEASLHLESWTHLVISGDDTVFSREFFDTASMNSSCDYMALRSMYIVNPYTRDACRMSCDFAIGPGRVLSRSVVQDVVFAGGLFREDCSRGLDYVADTVLSSMGLECFYLDMQRTLITDVKSRKNIWDFDIMKKISDTCTYREATSHFFGEEIVIMNSDADFL